ncbi:hypothetical protein [Niabella soli]|uniref:hypothetical protein n=1 Tax=Niabella soli TaxID=446683 RepID=UPI00031E2601|nr:hypothetical protein [Niabella soli]
MSGIITSPKAYPAVITVELTVSLWFQALNNKESARMTIMPHKKATRDKNINHRIS